MEDQREDFESKGEGEQTAPKPKVLQMPPPDGATMRGPPVMMMPKPAGPQFGAPSAMMMPPPDAASRPPIMMPAPQHLPPAHMIPPIQPKLVQVDGDWSEHDAGNGLKYYYNSKTKESTWTKPADFGQPKKPKPVAMQKIGETDWRKVKTNTGQTYFYNVKSKQSVWSVPAEIAELVAEEERKEREKKEMEEEEEEESGKRRLEDADSDGDNSKRQRTDEAMEGESAPREDGEIEEFGSKDGGPTHEERVEIFKQMLREKNVAPFSTWEKELPKFAFDPRFKILQNIGDRRTVFEQFSRSRAGEQRQEKKEKLTAARETVKKFADKFDHTTTFDTFKETLKREDSFRLLVSKEKEKLYSEFVGQLKKEREEKIIVLTEKAKENFKQLLKDTKDIDAKTTWAKARRELEDDPRYDDEMLTPTMKEELFKEHVASLDEVERRRRREEAALKDREREAQKLREKELRDRDRTHQKHREDEVVMDFLILLREKVRDPEASWTKTRPKLEEDPRWSMSKLTLEGKEKLFRDHTKMLQEAQVGEFRSLLTEYAKIGTINLTTTDFEQVKLKIRDDPRYEKIGSSERRTVFDRFMRDLKRNLIDSFQELLTENKNFGHISSKSATSGPKFDKLKELLKTDKRYAQLDPIAEEREKVMINFIQKVLDGKMDKK